MLPLYYNDGGALAAVYGGLFVVIFLFAVIVYVVGAIFMMKIFDKAGVQGKWRAWVPIYSLMVFSKLGDLSPWWILILTVASAVPVLNFVTGIALSAVLVMAAYRIGLKLQKEAAWAVLYFFLSLVWMGILAFDKSRWNSAVAPAPWAQSFLADKTVWAGIPVQTSAAAPQAPGYPAAPGYPQAPGYPAAPPAGYQPPAAPPAGYQPPAAPPAGYQPPATPPAGYQPPAAPPVAPEDPTAPRQY